MGCTGSAAIRTISNETSAGVLALVRKRWYSKPWAICTDETGGTWEVELTFYQIMKTMVKALNLKTSKTQATNIGVTVSVQGTKWDEDRRPLLRRKQRGEEKDHAPRESDVTKLISRPNGYKGRPG